MRAGKLRQRITIQRAQAPIARDDFGAETPVWVDLCTVSAEVRTPSGKEALASKALNAQLSHVVSIRYHQGLKPTDRVRYTDLAGQKHAYEITAVIDVEERHAEMQLQCYEVLA